MGLISNGGENLLDFLDLRQVLSTYDEGLSPFQGNLFSLHCLDFLAENGLTPRWHVGHPCGKTSWEASWESLEGKPQIP